MEAFSFCCHACGVDECFGSNRPFTIIWCVFSSILKNTLPLCLEDGLSLSRNGICGDSGGCFHHLFSLIASYSLVVIGALRFLRLHVSYCLLRVCEVRWRGGFFFGQSMEKFFYHPL